MPPFKMVPDNGGNLGKADGGLGNIGPGIGLDTAGKLLSFRLVGMGTDHHAVSAAFIGRFDHKLIQIVKHMGTVFVIPAHIGGHIRQNGVFPQVV